MATYDEWIRLDYESDLWSEYLQIDKQSNHWAKDVVRRTKTRDNNVNERFLTKKMNQLKAQTTKLCATISDLQIKLGNYWTHVPKQMPTTNTTSTITINNNNCNNNNNSDTYTDMGNNDHIRAYIDNREHTQHVERSIQTRIQSAKTEAAEFKALEDFEQIATSSQRNIHLLLKPKIKTWSTKNQNYRTALKLDESLLDRQETQVLYDKMRQ